MEVTPEVFEAVSQRGRRLATEYGASAARYDNEIRMICVSLPYGKELQFSPSIFRGLDQASPEQFGNIELGPAGVSLYFPDVDVDLSIPGLVHDVDGRNIRIV